MTTTTITKKRGSDFGLSDPAFWRYFSSLSMSTEELAWRDATEALYHAKRQACYDAAKAVAMVAVNATKTKSFTMTHHEECVRVAKGTFGLWKTSYEAKTPSLNGVPNPCYGRTEDDLFGTNAPTVADPDVAELAAWLVTQTWSTFAVSLAAQYAKTGSLSPKQVEAARSMKAKCAPKVETTSTTTSAPKETELDLSGLPSGTYAVPGGETRLKVRVARSRNVSRTGRFPAGTIFVSDDAEYGSRKSYGFQLPGSTYKGDIAEALRAILADPFEASKAYGRLVGSCGVCGRRLEDEVSIANGIGPICAGKF